MHRVRMLTSGAGPDGILPSGAVLVIADDLAKRLIEGEYAEDLGAVPEPKIETASIEPAAETATAPAQKKTTRRRSSRRKTKTTKAS